MQGNSDVMMYLVSAVAQLGNLQPPNATRSGKNEPAVTPNGSSL